jgi:hypothetical protein
LKRPCASRNRCSEDDPISNAFQRAPHHALGITHRKVVRDVEERDAGVDGFPEDSLGLGVVAMIEAAAERLTAESDDRNVQVRAAETAVLHAADHSPCRAGGPSPSTVARIDAISAKSFSVSVGASRLPTFSRTSALLTARGMTTLHRPG